MRKNTKHNDNDEHRRPLLLLCRNQLPRSESKLSALSVSFVALVEDAKKDLNRKKCGLYLATRSFSSYGVKLEGDSARHVAPQRPVFSRAVVATTEKKCICMLVRLETAGQATTSLRQSICSLTTSRVYSCRTIYQRKYYWKRWNKILLWGSKPMTRSVCQKS
jgi:hypothetical protein